MPEAQECLCVDHDFHTKCAVTLANAVMNPPSCLDLLYRLLDGDDNPDEAAQALLAVQYWIDITLSQLPPGMGFSEGTMGFMLSGDIDHPAFAWATQIMGARANNDEVTFRALVDNVEDTEQLVQGVCSVLFLCAYLLGQESIRVVIAADAEFDEAQVPRP